MYRNQDVGLDIVLDTLDTSYHMWRRQPDGSYRRRTIDDIQVDPDSLEERLATAALAIACSVFVVVLSVLIWTYTLVSIFKTS